jgi:hypothetical protein
MGSQGPHTRTECVSAWPLVECTRGAALQAAGLHLQGFTLGTPSKRSRFMASPIATDRFAGHMGMPAGQGGRDPSKPTPDEP